MINVKKFAHMFVLASALLAVFLVAANAMPSPYAQPVRVSPDFNSEITTLAIQDKATDKTRAVSKQETAQSETVGIGSTAEERALFETPREEPTQRAPRCSVNSIVFAKITLAQACF